MADLTAIVLTKDEEKNLPDCLSSLRGFASRVVVVDSGSTDRTVDVAREYGADVFTHPFRGYAHQFNWGLDNAGIDTEWVLRIDADERMTEAVRPNARPSSRRSGRAAWAASPWRRTFTCWAAACASAGRKSAS